MALEAVAQQRFKAALLWMGVAVVIDGVDGPLARRVEIKRVLPAIDGTLLDNLVDYLNYVVVPAWFLHRAALLPEGLGLAGAAAICLASAFQFTQTDAKTADHFFKGFPSYWNLLVLYLLVLRPDPRLALLVVAALCVLVFVPVRYVYPSRTREYRPLTLGLTAAWLVALLGIVVRYPDPAPWLVWASLLYVVYYVALSLLLTARRRRRSRR